MSAGEILEVAVSGQEKVSGQAGSTGLAETVGVIKSVRIEPGEFLEESGEDLVGTGTSVASQRPHGALVLRVLQDIANDPQQAGEGGDVACVVGHAVFANDDGREEHVPRTLTAWW